MEEHEKNHILGNLDRLVRTTFCRSIFIAQLVANGVLGLDDIQLLDAIPNELQKSLAFYQIMVTRENSFGPLLEALQETSQSGASEVLKRLQLFTPTSQSNATNGDPCISSKKTRENNVEKELQKNKSICFDVRPPVQLFTGRQQEVINLHEKLKQSRTHGTTTVVSQMASITGLGGIGKTELCRRYIQEHTCDYDGNIVWITAEKEEVMQESFLRLAKDVLQLSLKDANGGNKDITTIVDEVYSFFSNRKSLFIFDNAESGEHLEKFMPFRVQQKPHILITSRDREWEFEMDVMILNELEEQDAITFAKKGLGLKKNDDSQNELILQLVTTLQRFPLALQQAISFIKQQRMVIDYDVSMYLKSYQTNSRRMLDSKITAGSFNSYKRTTFTTWKMTTEQIAADEDYGPLATNILNMIAYLGADNIPRKVLNGLGEEHEVIFALRLLVKYSMVESQPNRGTLSIHRLVQEVTRIELKNGGKEEEMLKQVLQLLLTNDYGISSAIDHVIVTWNHAVKYSDLAKEFSSLPSQITNQLFHLQRYIDVLCSLI